MSTISRPVGAFVLVWVTASCMNADSPGPRFTAVDVGGVTTAHSRSPRGRGQLADRLFQFGMAAGPEHLLFDRVVGVTRLDDGALAVGNRGSNTVRVFTDEGRLITEFGGEGEGPGEFTLLRAVVRCRRGVITAWDWNYRQVWFARDGRVVDSWLITLPGERLGVYRMSCNGYGQLVATGWGNAGLLDHPVGGYSAEGGLYVAVNPTGPLEQVGTIGVADRTRLAEGELPNPFGRTTSIASTDDGFVLGSASSYEVTVHTFEGDTSLVFRWDGPNRTVGAEDRAAYLEWRLTSADETEHAAIRREVAQFELPDSLPAYSDIRVGAGGVIWIRAFHAPWRPNRTWWAFLPNGEWAWELELEPDFEVSEFGPGEVLGVASDELGVEAVRGYRMELRPDSI